MAKRLRRFTMTIGGVAVTGARNFRFDDNSEWNSDRADNEGAGDPVRMSVGPFPINFEMLQSAGSVESGYSSALVVVAKEITNAGDSETSANKTYTFGTGYLKVGGDHPTEGAGRIPVTGEFKTLDIT